MVSDEVLSYVMMVGLSVLEDHLSQQMFAQQSVVIFNSKGQKHARMETQMILMDVIQFAV